MLAQAVAVSHNMADVQRALGLRISGGSHAHLRRRIDRLGIDTSHFTGSAHNRGKPALARRTPGEILVLRRPDQPRAKPPQLRRALLESGVPNECSSRGVGTTWIGKSLTLHVDHINGDYADCRLENVRFLCPNCHSQSATYAGRNRRAYLMMENLTALQSRSRAEILRCFLDRKLSVAQVAALIGCSRSHVYRMAKRLREHSP